MTIQQAELPKNARPVLIIVTGNSMVHRSTFGMGSPGTMLRQGAGLFAPDPGNRGDLVVKVSLAHIFWYIYILVELADFWLLRYRPPPCFPKLPQSPAFYSSFELENLKVPASGAPPDQPRGAPPDQPATSCSTCRQRCSCSTTSAPEARLLAPRLGVASRGSAVPCH